MNGDEQLGQTHEEFMRLFSQHARRVYQFILALAMNHADADEVYQNTCVILWRKFESYDPGGSFYAWACRIAQLELMQVRRKNKRMQTFSEDVLNLLADHALSRGEELGSREDALADCLAKLNDADRRLIEQRYYDERAPKEIARQRSISVHSVYRALARIHIALRECVHRTIAREQAR
jgi:RNA polymerase sigma-70 factor (ECF subfamily)